MTNQDTLKDLLSLCAEIISKYNDKLLITHDQDWELWDNFIDSVDAASAAYGLSHALNDPNKCPKCGSNSWDWANIGFSEAKQCTDCGEIFFGGSFGKPWVEITKGQIDDCLKHSDNHDFAWAIEAVCKRNNGY